MIYTFTNPLIRKLIPPQSIALQYSGGASGLVGYYGLEVGTQIEFTLGSTANDEGGVDFDTCRIDIRSVVPYNAIYQSSIQADMLRIASQVPEYIGIGFGTDSGDAGAVSMLMQYDTVSGPALNVLSYGVDNFRWSADSVRPRLFVDAHIIASIDVMENLQYFIAQL